MSWQKVGDEDLAVVVDEIEMEVTPEVIETVTKPRRGRPKKNDDEMWLSMSLAQG
jgi:hypothetical protein